MKIQNDFINKLIEYELEEIDNLEYDYINYLINEYLINKKIYDMEKNKFSLFPKKKMIKLKELENNLEVLKENINMRLKDN